MVICRDFDSRVGSPAALRRCPQVPARGRACPTVPSGRAGTAFKGRPAGRLQSRPVGAMHLSEAATTVVEQERTAVAASCRSATPPKPGYCAVSTRAGQFQFQVRVSANLQNGCAARRRVALTVHRPCLAAENERDRALAAIDTPATSLSPLNRALMSGGSWTSRPTPWPSEWKYPSSSGLPSSFVRCVR